MSRDYCVYEHTFPNGKKYIGITSDVQKRWRNGKGYETQDKVNRTINKYGWDNIQHNIIVDGITKEQAETLEKYLIAELHTINNGYNVSSGGKNITAYYLDAYVLKMINYIKRYKEKYDITSIFPVELSDGIVDIIFLVEEGKTDKEIAEWANEASRAVVQKHRKYSTTSEDDVLAYWFHMREYFILDIYVKQGKNVENWCEAIFPPERYTKEQIDRKG